MEKIICSNCESDTTSTAKYCSSCGYELPKIRQEPVNYTVQDEKVITKGAKKKIIERSIGVVIFFITFFGVQQLFFTQSELDKEMTSIASELNKTCPVMVDSETQLDNTMALPDKVFQYNYTLVNADKSQVDILKMKNYLEPAILNLVKSSPQMQYQRDHKWTLNYNYRDKNGTHLLLLVITPKMYLE